MPDPTSQQTQTGADNSGTPTGVSLGTQTAAAQTGVSTSSTGSEGGNDGGGNKPWYDGLVKDADNLNAIKTANWGDLDATLKSYRELQSKLSSSRPASQAPSDPKGYKFTVPDDMKSSYNSGFADAFATWAHKAGLSQEAAATIHDSFVGFAKESLASQMAQSSEDIGARVTGARTSLEQTSGTIGTPAFARNLEMAKRSIAQLDPALSEELRQIGAITKVGNEEMIAAPALFKALAKVGGQLFAEDTLYGEASNTKNPFDPKTSDMAMQSHIVRTDPAKAKLLIRAAGQEDMWRHFL